jgi:hypothetical protein
VPEASRISSEGKRDKWPLRSFLHFLPLYVHRANGAGRGRDPVRVSKVQQPQKLQESGQ